MTPEQQLLVPYAEAMGWTEFSGDWEFGVPALSHGTFLFHANCFWVNSSERGRRVWNPLTDANNALELAEKLFMDHGTAPTTKGKVYWAAIAGCKPCRADTLPAAICAAATAALGAKGGS